MNSWIVWRREQRRKELERDREEILPFYKRMMLLEVERVRAVNASPDPARLELPPRPREIGDEVADEPDLCDSEMEEIIEAVRTREERRE